MTLAQLQTELYARGFEYLNDGGAGVTRATRWLNEAMHEINDEDDWPFLETTSSGVVPLTIADLRKVVAVTDSTDGLTLSYTTKRFLAESYDNLATVGNPVYYYTSGNVINTYPVKAVAPTLAVTYLKVAADLSAAGDTPLMPARYHDIIIQGAVVRALIDSDDADLAAYNEKLRQEELERMRLALLDSYPSGSRVETRRQEGR